MLAQPNPLAFKPQTMTGLLDQAVRLYRRHLMPMLGIVAVTQIPTVLITIVLVVIPSTLWGQTAFAQLSAGSVSEVFGPAYFLTLGGSLLASVLTTALSVILYIAGAHAAGNARLGLPVSVSGTYRFVFQSLSAAGSLVLWILLGLVAIGLWSIFVICLGWVTSVGLFLFFNGLVLPLASAALVWEGCSGADSLRRGWELGQRKFWWAFGFVLLVGLFVTALTLGPSLLISWAAGQVAGGAATLAQNPALSLTTQAISTLVQSLMAVVVTPISLIACALLYFDLREKTEGLSLALSSADPAMPIVDRLKAAPVTPSGSLLTGQLLLNLVAITVAVLALYAIVVALAAALGIGLAALNMP